MKSIKKLTVTIGIPAYNEQENIFGLLGNILSQNNTNFEIKNIIVVSDGSSDNTCAQVRKVKDKRIILLDDKKRLGKIKRINQIFKLSKSDVIVIMDADCIPKDKNTIAELVKPMIGNIDIAYTSGAAIPIPAKNFIEKSIQISRSVWDKVRIEYKEGNSLYSCHGLLYCLRSSFAKKYPFPEKIWTDIGFHYLTCLKYGKVFVSVKSAGSLFRTPANIHDYLSQIGRYQNENNSLVQYFGSWILGEYKIPKKILLKHKALTFIRYPIHCIFILLVNIYAKYNKRIVGGNAKASWSTISSTKLKINND